MSNSFTYIIRSNTGNQASNNINVRLTGLPTTYHKFYCEVVGFFVGCSLADALVTGVVIELRANDMGLLNGRDSVGSNLRTVAITNLNNTYPQSTFGFTCENFNNRMINFQLYDEYGNLLVLKSGGAAFNKPWILVLKITPIE